MKNLFCAALIVLTCAAATFGAAQPIPGVDIIAKKNPGGVRLGMFVGGGGGLNIPNGFFYPTFVSAAVFGAGQDVDGNGGLDRGAVLHQERFTLPIFSAAPPYNVDAKINELLVVSGAPLDVGAGQFRDWSISISSTAMGQLTLSNETLVSGRVIDSFFDVFCEIDFTPVGGGPVQSLSFTDRLHYDGTPAWANNFPDSSSGPDGTNFVLGTDGLTMSGARLSSESSGIFKFDVQSLPEPGAAAVMMIGALAALRRYRRYN